VCIFAEWRVHERLKNILSKVSNGKFSSVVPDINPLSAGSRCHPAQILLIKMCATCFFRKDEETTTTTGQKNY
jgi:hypothetical protein